MKRKTLIFTICVVLFAVCLCALIALMVFVMFNDISHFF